MPDHSFLLISCPWQRSAVFPLHDMRVLSKGSQKGRLIMAVLQGGRRLLVLLPHRLSTRLAADKASGSDLLFCKTSMPSLVLQFQD